MLFLLRSTLPAWLPSRQPASLFRYDLCLPSSAVRPCLQRELGTLRGEAAHLSASVQQLEGELEVAHKRMRALEDDLEEARAPYMADQGA